MLEWEWCHFNDLTIDQLYSVLAARQAVFIVEQDCPYQDADGIDVVSYHLLGWGNDDQGQRVLAAYARIIPPGIKMPELAIGRVITTQAFRGKGCGKELLKQAVDRAEKTFPDTRMYLSAQAHLQHYYQHCGFDASGDIYDEDGIPHIAMYRR